MNSEPVVLYEVRDYSAWITLNRPEARNALSAEVVDQLYRYINTANSDPNVRTLILTGAGRCFCSGADLKRKDLSEPREKGASYDQVLSALWYGQKPVITAVNGHAFAGGIGLIGASDIVITDEDAIFSFSEVRLGLIPAIISVVCLPKLGIHHGTRLFLTGERFNGTDAANYGLAHHAVPKDRLMSTVQEMINALGYCAPTALIECKRLVRRMSELSVDDGFREALPWSKKMFDAPEGLEGMAAFKEKRLPKWVKQ
tara:strand:+ start:416 stop:1186 length:771 start_codon:yes stop_codon:yes gene_type:complete